MPSGDRTGPAGMGSRTGRGAGFCAGYAVPGYMNPGGAYGGFGGRGGFGGGRGHRNRYWATGLTGWQRAEAGMPLPYGPAVPWVRPPTSAQELSALREHVASMEESLKQAQERIRELEKEATKE